MLKSLLKNKYVTFPVIIFIILEIVFWILVQTVGGGIICFSSVVLAFLFSAYFYLAFAKNSDGLLTVFALLFTVCSDFCLVILDPWQQLVAMVFFSIVQLLYFCRICLKSKNRKDLIVHLSVRIMAIIISLVTAFIVLKERTDALSLISMFYYSNLLINIVFSLKYRKYSLLLPIGLICFVICDTLVGLSQMSNMYFDFAEDSFLYKITHTDFDLIWFFYVPAQTLLALSPIETTRKKS